MNFQNESVLLQALRKGNHNAYIYLIETYNKKMYGYARALIGDHAMAEDVIQNVFLKTWEKRKKLHITSSLQNYLLKSVYNEFLNQYKKNQTKLQIELKYHSSLELAIQKFEDNSLEKIMSLVKKEVQNLPPKCKQVFLLSRNEGLSNLEISEYLNISVKTVEAHIAKAFSTLRKKIEPSYRSIFVLILKKLQYQL